MPEWMRPREFHAAAAAAGVDDWRVLGSSVAACFATTSLAAGAELAVAIGRLTSGTASPPAVDVRSAGVTIRFAGSEQGFRAEYVDLARSISAAARELGATADPSRVQEVQLAIDAASTDAVRPFWCAVLGYEEWGDEDAVDPRGIGPPIWFQPMDPVRRERNRIHVDVFVPHDQAEARVAAALAAGGRVVRNESAAGWWTLADPEGNEVDVADASGRG